LTDWQPEGTPTEPNPHLERAIGAHREAIDYVRSLPPDISNAFLVDELEAEIRAVTGEPRNLTPPVRADYQHPPATVARRRMGGQ
jgi:hypothetical protein